MQVVAMVVGPWIALETLIIRQTRRFVRGFCLSGRTFGSVGGRGQRNLLTFSQLCTAFRVQTANLLLESAAIFFFYKAQATKLSDSIFLMFEYSLSTGWGLTGCSHSTWRSAGLPTSACCC